MRRKITLPWEEKKELIDEYRREIDRFQELYLDKLEENTRLKAEIKRLKEGQ